MPKNNKIYPSSDKEFYELVNKYVAENEQEEEKNKIAYEEAQLKKYEDMIKFYTEQKEKSEDNDFKEYCDDVIEGYTKKLNEPISTYTKEDIIAIMDKIKNTSEFERLPIPKIYLEHLATHNDEYKEELERVNYMEKQVKTKDTSKRLDNYKEHILNKIDRKKLDLSLKK
jgi:hypothetical protein